MANRRIRIYEGAEATGASPATNFIGMSSGAADLADNPRFKAFLAERGYTIVDEESRPQNGVSMRYVEVQPPLTREHALQLGILCVGGMDATGHYTTGLVDSGNNSTAVYDNRQTPDIRPFGDNGILLASA